jgi:hypothetical protein
MEKHTPHVVIWRGVIVIHVNLSEMSTVFHIFKHGKIITDLTSGGIMKQVRIQQNCAPPHFNLTVLLNSLRNFPRIGCVSLSSPPPMPRPLLSPDLITPDDSLWGIMKGKLAVRLYNTHTELRAGSIDAFGSLKP